MVARAFMATDILQLMGYIVANVSDISDPVFILSFQKSKNSSSTYKSTSQTLDLLSALLEHVPRHRHLSSPPKTSSTPGSSEIDAPTYSC
uniref:Ovule protein n=1 Tax=Steinernema glaseri TaxID=37863 RepID=A0A1I7YN95_9BILA